MHGHSGPPTGWSSAWGKQPMFQVRSPWISAGVTTLFCSYFPTLGGVMGRKTQADLSNFSFPVPDPQPRGHQQRNLFLQSCPRVHVCRDDPLWGEVAVGTKAPQAVTGSHRHQGANGAAELLCHCPGGTCVCKQKDCVANKQLLPGHPQPRIGQLCSSGHRRAGLRPWGQDESGMTCSPQAAGTCLPFFKFLFLNLLPVDNFL